MQKTAIHFSGFYFVLFVSFVVDHLLEIILTVFLSGLAE
jgi:hypothetical protein